MDKLKVNTYADEFEEEHIIDAAKDFYCSGQDEEYNKSYYKWRSNPDNPYCFRFVKNTKENVYIDGKGFVEQNPKKTERDALAKYAFLLGGILSLYFTIEIFGEGLLCLIFKLFGGDVSWSVVGGVSGGGEFLRILNQVIVGTLKRIVPIIVLMKATKIPWINAVPMKVVHSQPHKSAVPLTMVMVAVVTFMNALYMNVLSFINITETTGPYYFPPSFTGQSIMILTDILLIPVVSEICLRGVLMQSLRQYGDGFALILTSLIAALMTHDITQSCSIFIMALCIGYFVLETGSVKTGIIMRITYRLCAYIQFALPYFVPSEWLALVQTCYLLTLVLVGLIWLIFVNSGKRDFVMLRLNKTYMNIKEKIQCVFTSQTIVLWLVFTYILTLAKLRFLG